MKREGYQPTPEEMKAAEEMMTKEEKMQSEARAEGFGVAKKEAMIESGEYQSIGDFHEGYAVATKVNSGGEVWSSFEGKFQQHGPSTRLYILNEHFEEVGGPYSSVEDFFEDRAIVGVMNEGYFYVDKDFKKIAGPFDSAEPFLDGRAQVAKQGKSYWIGLDGEEIAGAAKI